MKRLLTAAAATAIIALSSTAMADSGIEAIGLSDAEILSSAQMSEVTGTFSGTIEIGLLFVQFTFDGGGDIINNFGASNGD
jgi:hypothetical protein